MSGRVIQNKIIGTAFGMLGGGYKPYHGLGVSSVRRGLGGMDASRPWMQDQRTRQPVTLPTLWRHSVDDQAISGDPDAWSVEKLYGQAVKGQEDAKFTLARMAIENPRAVGVLYDLWKNGDETAGITLGHL